MESKNLYFLNFKFEYEGLSQKELIEIWCEEASFALKAKEAGLVRQIWKAVGERRLLIVVQASQNSLDAIIFNLPIVKVMGNQVHITIKPLQAYESFYTDVNIMLGKSEKINLIESNVISKDKIFFWVQFDIEYHGYALNDLLQLWSEDTKHQLQAKERGIVVDIWKVVGERKCYAIMAVDKPDTLDRYLFELPILKKMGNQVKVTVTSVRRYEDLADDLKMLSKSS